MIDGLAHGLALTQTAEFWMVIAWVVILNWLAHPEDW